MKRGKYFFIKQSAIFMIFLILSMPVISALSISKITVAGSEGIENVMSSDNDYFTATVETSEPVTKDQLRIKYTKDEAFDECSGTTCTYTSSSTDRAGQEMSYTIQLINSSTIVDEATGTLLIDEVKPEITSYAIDKTGEEIILSYKAEDTACEDCSSCSGIDYLSIVIDDAETEQINIASQCSIDDDYETSISELNIADGDHEICLIAYDNVGHQSAEKCTAVSVDSEAPYFETNSLQVTETTSNNKVEYISNNAILTNIKINVSDTSLDTTNVYADLSALNSVIGSSYSNMSGYCEQNYDDDTKYVCTWSNVYIEGVSGALKLSFFAADTEGNLEVYSPSYTVTKDDSAPTVVQVYKQEQSDSHTLYLKDGTNSVYADFDATGSAMSFGKAYMTFNLASLNKKQANSCWENGAYWTCVWNFTLSYSGTSSTSLYIDAKDDAGNAMEQYDMDVEVDATEPEITSMSTSLDCPTASDILMIEINATDDSDELFVSLYGEDVRTSDDAITEECSMITEGEFTCLITVNDLVSYPEDEDVKIEVSDSAGNIADDELDISVCELEQSGTPNLVTVYVDDASPVDKMTLSYIDYPLYVPMVFSMTSGAHIVSKTASCEEASMYFIDQSEKETLAVLNIPKQTVANGTSTLQIGCTLSLTMQYGNNVYMNPEQENVTIEVELYGTPLGSIEDSINAKIEMQKMGIREAQGKIDKWVTANRILGVLCNIAQLLAKADAVLAGVRNVIAAIQIIIYHVAESPAAAVALPAYEALNAYEIFANGFHGFVSKWVWPVGYFPSSFGVIVKWGCLLYTGKLCEGFDGLENKLAVSADEYGTPAYYDQYANGELNKQQEHAENLGGWLTWFYDWDPYKSIHTARSCLYIDAVIYNMRKERQINCMYTKCLEENAKMGLPTEVCDVQFKERECLYVEGATWMAAGTPQFIHRIQLLLNTIISNADVFALGIYYWFSPCFAWERGTNSPQGIIAQEACYALSPYVCTAIQYSLGMIGDTGCHTYAGGLALVETDYLTGGLDWDFQANLEGTDYCVGYE